MVEDNKDKDTKWTLVGIVAATTIASAALGAVRGYEESQGMVKDPTMESDLINSAIIGPTGLGALLGAGLGTLVAVDSNEGFMVKAGLVSGCSLFGLLTTGVPAYVGTGIGYALGRLAGYYT